MNEERTRRLADRLIEAEQGDRPRAEEVLSDRSFEQLLLEDRRFEERVRRVALFSWALTLVCLVSALIPLTFAGQREGTALGLARAALVLFGTTGMISLLVATVTSLAWLFRSRTPTLRAIERRLAALERLLLERR